MKVEEIFADTSAQNLLSNNNLANFEALWSLDIGWFEEPNKRRGGWSGVSRYTLENGSSIFIKRQQNHFYYSWRNLFRPVTTFKRELANILAFQKLGIPALELIYFGLCQFQGETKSILITKELEGFQPLEALKPFRSLDKTVRTNLIQQAAEVIRLMHDNKIQHNCLYAKHIFTKINQDKSVEVRLIDLEKAKRHPFRRQAMLRDLGTLFRHTGGWGNTDRLRFFLAYRLESRVSMPSRRILENIVNKTRTKEHRSSIRATKAQAPT